MAANSAEHRRAVAQASATYAWMDPLAAYRRLRATGAKPILLDGSGAHPHARYAFIACNPLSEVRIDGDTIVETAESGLMDARIDPPLKAVRELASRYSGPAQPHPFTGGWIGLLGFAFGRAIEPTLPASPPAGVPDALFWLCPDAIVFDRRTQEATLYAADLEGDGAGAQERLHALRESVARGEPALVPAAEQSSPDATSRAEAWRRSLNETAFTQRVDHVKQLIHDGDLFQANLATRFTTPLPPGVDAADLFERLRRGNPSPYMALVESRYVSIVSGSPEQLFAVRGGKIQSRPIAGTRKRGRTPDEDLAMENELRNDAKEQAEHTMLVDLVRNDIAKVAVAGTVRVAEHGSVERYSHVMHLASLVEAQVRPATDLADWLAALFPGGTITGAPKVRATQRILEAEPVARGFYTGSIGYLGWSGEAEWNILIRTLQVQGRSAHVHAGSGIVADSDARREWKEAHRKAQAIRDVVEPPGEAGARTGDDAAVRLPGRLGEVVRTGSWEPPSAAKRHIGKRVLLVDNYDSFVHNLAGYCSALGAVVRVVRNDAAWEPVVEGFRPTHIVLSPGPGWPRDAGSTPDIAKNMHGKIPILGVCLGHQAIGEAHGGQVIHHPDGPVHGKPDSIAHDGSGLFAGLPSPIVATRYHSLIVDTDAMHPDWRVDARLADGTVMALRHEVAPTFGLQFHPESLCTPRGLELLDRFLESKA